MEEKVEWTWRECNTYLKIIDSISDKSSDTTETQYEDLNRLKRNRHVEKIEIKHTPVNKTLPYQTKKKYGQEIKPWKR